MLLRGNRVVLIADDDESQYTIPESYWLVWDSTGKRMRRCDVFILRCSRIGAKGVEFDPRDVSEAEDYWGSRDQWAPYRFTLPRGPWKKVGRIARIGYRRGRTGNWMHPGPDLPPLDKPVTLYEGPDGWRLRMPGDCVLDDRGFIYP